MTERTTNSPVVVERETDLFLLRHQDWLGAPIVIGNDHTPEGERLSCNCGWRTAWRTDDPGTEDMAAWLEWGRPADQQEGPR